ncbi:MAG: hypothetical protein LBB05_00085 [Puniceicoccales bacterium]|jgi:outer membrane protein assembly factor BamD (BamD/ComL family)|nr:hypothetical protein [Puniceicoccales bacterium]
MNVKSVFSVCLFLPCISFGVLINNKHIAVSNKEDMKKIYHKIKPTIRSGKFNEAARILSEAHGEYVDSPTKKRNPNRQETPYWAYLDSAIKCYGKYDRTNPNSQKSRGFRRVVVDSIKLAFPGIAQVD